VLLVVGVPPVVERCIMKVHLTMDVLQVIATGIAMVDVRQVMDVADKNILVVYI
jgi:hypothetical protein